MLGIFFMTFSSGFLWHFFLRRLVNEMAAVPWPHPTPPVQEGSARTFCWEKTATTGCDYKLPAEAISDKPRILPHALFCWGTLPSAHISICKLALCAITQEYSQRNSKSDILVISVVSHQFHSRPCFTLSSPTTTHFISHSNCTLILLDFAAQLCLLVCIITRQKLICKP